jgi:hypothetical protein
LLSQFVHFCLRDHVSGALAPERMEKRDIYIYLSVVALGGFPH